MDSKKSLGHFPFGPDSQGDSDYSFIPDLNGPKDIDVAELENTDFSDSRTVENKDQKPFEDSGADDQQYIQVGSVKVKRSSQTESIHEVNSEEPSEYIVERELYNAPPSDESSDFSSDSRFSKSKKKVVSYYLDEELIEQVKTFADKNEESYSAVAAEAFRAFINRIE